MKIVVCVKQIVDPEFRLRLDATTNSIDERDIVYVINPADMFALEEALRIRDMSGKGQVVALTMGPPWAKRALIDCLARGVDKAVHLWDETFEGSDNHVTSMILATAIDLIGYDLILCGRQAADDNSQQVPAAIAGILGLPFVSAVAKIEMRLPEKKVISHRCLERGDREIVECSLPALFSVEAGINKPRCATLKLRLQAEKAEIATWGGDILGLKPDEVGRRGSMVEVLSIAFPRPRTKKISCPDTKLPPHLRIQWLMKGGAVQDKSRSLIEGSPEEAASTVLQFLTEGKILSIADLKN